MRGFFSKEDSEQLTPSRLLALGAYHGRTDVINEALRLGADPNASVELSLYDEEEVLRETALHIAVRKKHKDCIRVLLAAGAGTGRDENGKSAWELVDSNDIRAVWNWEVCHRAGRGDLFGLQKLVDTGVDVNGTDASTGNSPLHWASCFGKIDCVKALIFRDAKLDATNVQGMTPLMDAVKARKRDIVKVLLDAGASPNISIQEGKDMGKTAVDFTTDPAILKLLRCKRKGETLINGGCNRSAKENGDDLHQIELPKQNGSIFDLIPVTSPSSFRDYTNTMCGTRDLEGLPLWARLLWPRPQIFLSLPSAFFLAETMTISYDHEVQSDTSSFISLLKTKFPERKFSVVASDGDLRLAIDSALLARPASFRIEVRSFGISLRAADKAGFLYALDLLVAIMSFRLLESRTAHMSEARVSSTPKRPASKKTEGASVPVLKVPGCIIEDWPTILNRAALVDLTSRRLKLDSITHLIKQLSRLRYNSIHLNFALNDTPDFEFFSILRSHCHANHIQLVPCVTLGPSTIKGSEKLLFELRDMLGALGSNAIRLNFGRDLEAPYDSADADVHIASVVRLCEIFKRRVVLYPAGILIQILDACDSYEKQEPVIRSLPARAIAVVEAGVRTFNTDAATLAQLGVPYYVSISTEACNSFAGRLGRFTNSLAEVTKEIMTNRPIGVSACDWAGVLHLQPRAASYASWLLSASLGWNPPAITSLRTTERSLLVGWIYFEEIGENSLLGEVLCALGSTQGQLYHIVENSRSISAVDPELVKKDLKNVRRVVHALRRYRGLADQDDLNDIRLMVDYMQMSAEVALLTGVESQADSSLVTLSDCCNDVIRCIEGFKRMAQRTSNPGSYDRGVKALQRVLSSMQSRREYEESAQIGWIALLTQ